MSSAQRDIYADLEAEFDAYSEQIQAALDESFGYELSDIREMVLGGTLQLWTFQDTAALTEVITYPRTRAINVFLVAGKMGDCLSLLPRIENFATVLGCSAITGIGRRGWEGHLKDLGFEVESSYMKELR